MGNQALANPKREPLPLAAVPLAAEAVRVRALVPAAAARAAAAAVVRAVALAAAVQAAAAAVARAAEPLAVAPEALALAVAPVVPALAALEKTNFNRAHPEEGAPFCFAEAMAGCGFFG